MGHGEVGGGTGDLGPLPLLSRLKDPAAGTHSLALISLGIHPRNFNSFMFLPQ